MLRTKQGGRSRTGSGQEISRRRLQCFEWNRRIGWTTICLGAAVGLVLGLWSFEGPLPVPSWLGGYAQVGRRLVRLGHIALFGLGILNVLLAGERERLARRPRGGRFASWAMNFGNIFLPLTLFGAAAYRPLKYAMSVPASAVFLALLIVAYCVWREPGEGEPAA